MVQARPAALNGRVPDNLPVISRPRDGAMLGGVCAGLARRWQIDPTLLRIAVAVLAVFGGLGVVAYACGLLLMPRDGDSLIPVRRLLPFTRRWSTGAVVTVTVLAAAIAVAVGFNGIGLGPIVVIFLIWFFGFRGRGSHTPPPQPPEPTPFERAAENWRHRLVEQQTPGYENAVLTAPQEPRWSQPYAGGANDVAVRDDDPAVPAVAAVARRRPRRWRRWWLALTLSSLGVLVVAGLGLAGLPTPPLAYAAAVLGGLGLTLLASTRSGRPPLLLPAALITALVTGSLLASAQGVAVPKVGEQHLAYRSASGMPDALTLQAGELTVDLSQLDLSADRDLTIRVGAGSVGLTLPADVDTQVTYTVDAGEATLFGARREGLNLTGTESSGTGSGGAVLRVTVDLDVGELTVLR
jgi:phage shock protein PspC (stress-responsive transcriptional regulator)